MNVYYKMGFPGAVGSVDATHIRWHMCPVEFVHAATGKEKHPSVAFQVLSLIIMYCYIVIIVVVLKIPTTICGV